MAVSHHIGAGSQPQKTINKKATEKETERHHLDSGYQPVGLNPHRDHISDI